jgi:hypothetical protein
MPSPVVSMDPYTVWFDLKQNSKIRAAMWMYGVMQFGVPKGYPYIDDVPTIEEATRPFRQLVERATPQERRACWTSIKIWLKMERIDISRAPQIPDSKWVLTGVKGSKKIQWLPGQIEKGE